MSDLILITTRKITFPRNEGYHWTVEPDGDGGLVELIYWEESPTASHEPINRGRVSMAPDAARLIARAMIQLADELEEMKK